MAFEVLKKNSVNKVKIQFLCLQQTFKEHLLQFDNILDAVSFIDFFLTPQKDWSENYVPDSPLNIPSMQASNHGSLVETVIWN